MVNTGRFLDLDNRVLVVGTDQCLSRQNPGRVLAGDDVRFTAKFGEIVRLETVLGAPLELPLVYCAD